MINIPRRKYLAFLSIDMSTMLCNKHISMFSPLTCTLVAYNRRDMLLFELHNNCGKNHGSVRYGFTFESIVNEEIIAERRDLHI